VYPRRTDAGLPQIAPGLDAGQPDGRTDRAPIIQARGAWGRTDAAGSPRRSSRARRIDAGQRGKGRARRAQIAAGSPQKAGSGQESRRARKLHKITILCRKNGPIARPVAA